MVHQDEVEFICIVDRLPRKIYVREWKTPVVLPGSNLIFNQIRVRIENQWTNYLFAEITKFEMAVGANTELYQHWFSPEKFLLMIIRDSVNMFLGNKGSIFTSTLQAKTLLISENDLINAISQEQNVRLPIDEALLLDLFLIGFERALPLSNSIIYLSTSYSYDEIDRKIKFFAKRKFIETNTNGDYVIKDAIGYDILEQRVEKYQQKLHNQTESIISTKRMRYLNPVRPQTDKPIAFIGLPFKLTDHYLSIENVCSSNGFIAYKIDRDPRFDTFLNKVLGAILASKVCIFDVTGFNANVMLELGVAMSTDVDIIVIAEEKIYVEEQLKWESEVKKSITPENIMKLEAFLKDSKFINLVPSDVRERSVHLFKDNAELETKLNSALSQVVMK